ncbi:cyclic pyranopterin monophosphate synthase [Francisella halioticida]|uniref:GTP 3',8-cyclase MoaA n=1 Tax=Francisella halioticida TaxID=549298 RepID=UPI001AF08810|nr:GTP 3',8-cyclase MoaA [Francisella halioticida]BCD92126.1 cyclic pyranopterin monophosphate synthase [Francisella halioticida]
MLTDSFGRKFTYLRLSLTDVCNFRCQYCLPNGYQGKGKKDNFLNLTEIKNLLRAMNVLQVQKVRLTGGEPTLRNDFLDILNFISSQEGIKTISLTTNGYSLVKNVSKYYESGLNNITISLDSLFANKFRDITQMNNFSTIMKGIEKALEIDFDKVKINAVLLKGYNDSKEDIKSFFDYVKDKKITVRFIELMETQDNLKLHKKSFITTSYIRDKLREEGWTSCARESSSGPAIEYMHKDYVGKIGIISPYSNIFCVNCNRVRVNSKGELYTCLFDKANVSLREYLQHEKQLKELLKIIKNTYSLKKESHYLTEGIIGDDKHFSTLGG